MEGDRFHLRRAARPWRCATRPASEQLATQRSVWSVDVSVPAQTPRAEPPAQPVADEQAAAPVESFADAGTQDGAASTVLVGEPWDGYRGMNAHDVIHRLATASEEEAVVVELYERSHGKRKTVLAAAERRLRRPAGAGSPS